MINIFQSIILGVVQSISEFLPISSSGHLAVIPQFFDWKLQSLSFDIALHLGTAIAVIAFFWKDWVKLIKAFVQTIKNRKLQTPDEKLIWYIIAATIPAAVAGYFFESQIENIFRHPPTISYAFLFTAFVLYISDGWNQKNLEIKSLKFFQALIVSLAQVIALMPGISRSGMTIAAGRFIGLTRENAARFSFLLATPIILGAAIFSIKDFVFENIPALILGTVVSAFVGYFAIKWFLIFIKKYPLWYFSVYLVILALLTLSYFSL